MKLSVPDVFADAFGSALLDVITIDRISYHVIFPGLSTPFPDNSPPHPETVTTPDLIMDHLPHKGVTTMTNILRFTPLKTQNYMVPSSSQRR